MESDPRAPVSVFDDPTPEPFAGHVRGAKFGPAEATALLFPARRAHGVAVGALVVVLDGRLHAAEDGGVGGRAAHVVISVSRAAGAEAVRIGPGRYTLAPDGLVEASALLVGPGGGTPPTRAVAGWIEIEAIDDESVGGAAVLELAGGGHLSGWFEARRSPRLARA